MKTLQILSRSPAFMQDGPPGVTLRISKELVKRGYEVTIFTTDASRIRSRLEIQHNPMRLDGVNVYHFRNVSHYLARKHVPAAPRMAVALSKHIESFDVIHLREYRTIHAALAHHYAKKKNVPLILQAHGALPRVYNDVVERQHLRGAFDRIYGLRILKEARMVIASTETEANQCKQMGIEERNIRIIPHAINLADYECLPEQGAFRLRYGLKNEDKIILYLGRITKVKGLDLLLDAFSMILAEVPTAKLVITGPDVDFLSVLERKTQDMHLSDSVIFTGPLYDKSKLEAYRDADVYVLPSKYESFSNAVLEASACGTPVILTDQCAIAGVFRKYGVVVGYDVKQLSDGLLTILKDDALRHKLAAKGKALVKREFTWDKVIKELEETYEEVARTV